MKRANEIIQERLYRVKKRFRINSVEEYKEHLIRKGVRIGPNTKLFSNTVYIDEQRPWMIEIGDYCKLTQGVMILQHDYSRSVLRRKYGEVIGDSKKTIIGNNVFIGVNSIVLMGANIGNNVVIGAGSVVSGNIPDDVVVAGNPARIIKTLDEYYSSRKEQYLDEAVQTFLEYKKTYNREPSVKEMGAFWPLYLKKSLSVLKDSGVNINYSADDPADIIDKWLKSGQAPFEGYEDFIYYCSKIEKKGQ